MVNSKGQRRYCGSYGQMHKYIEKHFPELAKYLKWHLTSIEGPVHYIANTVYHVQQGKLDYARSLAVWPDATDEELIAPGLEGRLRDRLKGLMEAFKADMSELFGGQVEWEVKG